MPRMDMPDGANVAVPGDWSLVKSSLSNKGNATASGFDNYMLIEGSQEVRLVDGAGNLLFSGTGPEAARQAAAIGDSLSKEYGNNASWKIQQGQKTAGGDIRWDTVANEKVNVNVALMALNAAVQIGVAVATAGMSIPAQAAIAAGTSAAMTLAEGGSITDAIKAGVMSAAPTLGAGYLGPMVQAGTNAAGKVVATTLGKAVAAGGSSTAMGLVTGQSLTKALTSGAISAGGQILAGELASSKPDELMQWASDQGIFDIQGGVANIDQAMGQIAAGVHTAGSAVSGAVAGAVPNAVSGIGGATPELVVTAPTIRAPSVNVAAPVISGIANAVQQPVVRNEEPETIVTAPEQPAPLYEVGPAPVPVVSGIGSAIPETIVTARPEARPVEESPATAGIGDIIVTAQPEAPPVNEDTRVLGEGLNLSPNMTGVTETLNADDMVQERAAEDAGKTEDDKSVGDYLRDASKVAALIPLVGKAADAIFGGGDSTSGIGGTSGPGVAFNPIRLTPTVTPESVRANGGRYPYTPATYGRMGGDQETEYTFFNRAPTTAPVTVPVTAQNRKEGGEMHDDMVKHLVEYQKGGGHQGPGKVTGIGSGQEDLIPAWLSDGEYVWSAQDVADLGDGSTDAGVRRLDKMRQMVRQQAGRKDVKKIAKPQKGIDTMLKAVGGQA